jgi:P4 family phage/plasmid primase-like protien
MSGDVADAGADLDAMVAAMAAEERKRSNRAQLKRAEIARRSSDDMEFFQFSEGGNGDRFASRYVGRILMDDSGQRPVYYVVTEESNRWRQDTTGERTRWGREVVDAMRSRAKELLDAAEVAGDQNAERAAKEFLKWARQSDTPTRINSMTRMACESWHSMVDPGADFDQRPDVLCTADDELIELVPGEGIRQRPVQPGDMITQATAVRYNPGILREPPQPVVEFCNLFMPDREYERKVRKVVGQALFGGNIHRLFVIMVGQTTTGKSQLMEAIDAALGGYSATGKPSVFRNNNDDRGRPDILQLLTKRIAIFNEASKEWELHGDRVKDITGGGNVAVRALHSNEVIQRRPMFTPIVLTNELPTIHGVDSGTRRRLLVVPWNHSLPPGVVEDPNVKERFVRDPAVLEWCLAWAVQGYIDAAREGLEDCRAEFKLATEAAIEQLSPVHAWHQHAVESGQLYQQSETQMAAYGSLSRCATLEQMHGLYVAYVKAHGNLADRRHMLSLTEFNTEMKKLGWEIKKSGAHRWKGWEIAALANLSNTLPFEAANTVSGSWTSAGSN